MRLDRRIIWLALFSAAIWLSVIDADQPVREAPLDPMSIRITVAADGAIRVEAPDGTNETFETLPIDDPDRANVIQLRRQRELGRLDPEATPDRLFEIVADASVPFLQLLRIHQSAFGLRFPRERRFTFSLSGARDAAVPFVWTGINEQGPGTAIIPYRVPMAKVRLLLLPGEGKEPAAVHAVAAIGDGELYGSLPKFEDGNWIDIKPQRRSIREWILRQKERPRELVGAVELRGADRLIPFGEVFEVMRGFADAGLPIDFRVDWGP